MLQIAICEDTQTHSQEISAAVERELKHRRAEIECFYSSGELLRYLSRGGYVPDLAVLDVRLNGESGIDLAETLNTRLPSCRIIFLSDELTDATEVYRAEHVWFLLRSQLRERIGQALRRALAQSPAERSEGLLLRGRGKSVFLPLGEILYLERDRRRTLVITERGEYSSSERPCKLLSGELAAAFVRSHRSYWVNRAKIAAMEYDEFILTDGQRVPISRSWRVAARDAFLHAAVE